jgi:geranylgeranyl diphosphate synthase type I
MTRSAPIAIARARDLVMPALRSAVGCLADEHMRRIAAYQLGWVDADGRAVEGGGGKAIRPTLAVLSAEAGGGGAVDGVPAAVAVELVHNFSLLHDDIMDGDLERRHRPTGWVVFGQGQAILGGTAMLTAAIDTLVADGEAGRRSLPCLLASTQRLISGQSLDLLMERDPDVTLEDVLRMEAGKTAALLSCSASIGAIAVGAKPDVIDGLAQYGRDIGIAFQLVDDILGVTGDPAVTGKSSSADVRVGKRSAPIVAALRAGTAASRRLAELLRDGPPQTEDDVSLATSLIADAGGLEWAAAEAQTRLDHAVGVLADLDIPQETLAELVALGRYIVERDR